MQRLKESYADNQSLELLAQKLRPAVYAVVSNNVSNEGILRRMETLLGKHGIKVVALKGIALMTGYYAEQYLRPIGDIDVWIRPEDVYEARQLLLEDGAIKRC